MKKKASTKGDQRFAQVLVSAMDNQSKRRRLKPDPADRASVQKLLGVRLPKRRSP